VATNSTGYASTSLTFGDRAGVYQVQATSAHSSITVEPTFSETAGQHFSLSVTEPTLTINLNPSTTPTSYANPTVSVTTNAASYSLQLLPNQWPTSAGLDTFANWASSLGFGWNLNGGTVTAYSTSTGNPAATTVYSCSGDTCQGTNGINVDIYGAVNYLQASGAYTNTMNFNGTSISY
jgi:hypothetical protein